VDRALTGTWVIDELRLAVERGYRVLELYDVYVYEVNQYNPETGVGLNFCGQHKWIFEIEIEGVR